MMSADIHARVSWPLILPQLGIGEEFLRGRKRPGPCPACGGRDRFFFDNRQGHGDHFCRHCGPGDGFALLMKVHRWEFREARRRVIEIAGLRDDQYGGRVHVQRTEREDAPVAAPTRRVLRLLRESCAIADCDDVVAYLDSRRLWPLPSATSLRAHSSVEYFEDGQRLGRFPALVAPVTDIRGELVTAHVTYLHHGRKLEPQEPRKLLSPLTGHTGCAVRLAPLVGGVLGIAEGIETALAAAKIHDVVVWAALSAAVLAKFEPPPQIQRLLIFADRDTAGMEAAARHGERLQGRIAFEIKPALAPAKDWADSLNQEQIP